MKERSLELVLGLLLWATIVTTVDAQVPPPPATPHTIPAASTDWTGRFECPGLATFHVDVRAIPWNSVSVTGLRADDRDLVKGLPEFNESLSALTHLTWFRVQCSDGFAVLSLRGFTAGPTGGDVLTEASIGPDGLTPPVQSHQ